MKTQAEAHYVRGDSVKHPDGHQRADRADTHVIAGHFKQDAYFAWRDLLVRIGRGRGAVVTSQKALAEAIGDFFRKYGVEPPADLRLDPPEPPRLKRRQRPLQRVV